MAIPKNLPDTPDLQVKTGDRRPFPEAQLLDENGDPVDLTTAVAVRFIMRRAKQVAVVDGVATIVTATQGRVQYQWAAGDTDIVEADYLAEWEVEWPDGDRATYPSDSYNLIRVREDLGGTS